MDIRVGDGVRLKKQHPCGSREWLIERVGVDFRMKCQGCQRQVMIPREKLEKRVRRIIRDGQEINPNAPAKQPASSSASIGKEQP